MQFLGPDHGRAVLLLLFRRELLRLIGLRTAPAARIKPASHLEVRSARDHK